MRLGWDTRFDASNGNIVVNGRLAGADFALVKTGGHDLIANGGAIDLDRADIKEGRLVLLGASGAIRPETNSRTGSRALRCSRRATSNAIVAPML